MDANDALRVVVLLRKKGSGRLLTGWWCGVGSYTSLQKLRLRGNELRSLDNTGIEQLPNLTVLDLRDNKLLLDAVWAAEDVLAKLQDLVNLRFLGLEGNVTGVPSSGDPDHIAVARARYRVRVLRFWPNLADDPRCPLQFLDLQQVGVDEAVAALASRFPGTAQDFTAQLGAWAPTFGGWTQS